MSIQVIGAGLGRTGTASMKRALEALGYVKCYHMEELINDPSRLPYWKTLSKTGSTDFQALFEGYQAAVDNPACLFYKEIFDAYPEAKVVLTVRDPEDWYESTSRTIHAVSPTSISDVLKLIYKSVTNKNVRKIAPVFKFADDSVWKKQFRGRFKDKAFALDVFQQHIEEVKNTVPTNQLLIYEVKDGWEPLCSFLGKEVPTEDFPYRNTRGEFQKSIERLFKEGSVDL